MSRGLWFVAGAGAGVYAVVRGRRAAEALTVDGLTDRIQGAAAGWRVLRDEAAQARTEKESELRERIAAMPPGRAALGPAATPQIETHPPARATSHTDQEESTS